MKNSNLLSSMTGFAAAAHTIAVKAMIMPFRCYWRKAHAVGLRELGI